MRRPECLGLLGLVLGLLDIGAVGPAAHGQPAAPAAPTGMERALALLTEARLRFRDIRDYECALVKRERVNGNLSPEHVLMMRVRNRPYSVYLRWLAPETLRGQEVCYVAGRNAGMMRVHPVGLQGIFGFVSIDPQDPRAFEANRHPITEAGLGSLLENTARYWEVERRLNKTQVRIADYQFDGRPCTWIETTHPDRGSGSYYAYRCVLCLDKATLLPVRVEAYDWPRPDGPRGGDLIECYSYLKLRPNVGLGDDAFDH
ncbi:MAG TPA: DUF1571 domain-containing protein [Gemmataceae bacterium]|jgi:hypothetical protein|nr:DUF1571 domain-containing protein [Gemmataceae bacterium]